MKQSLIDLFKTCCDSPDYATSKGIVELPEFRFLNKLDVLRNPEIHPECFNTPEPIAAGYQFWLEEDLAVRIVVVSQEVMTPKYKVKKSPFYFLTKKYTKIFRDEAIAKFDELKEQLIEKYTVDIWNEEDRMKLIVYQYYIEFDSAVFQLTADEYQALVHFYFDTKMSSLQKLAEVYLEDLSDIYDDGDEDDDEEDED